MFNTSWVIFNAALGFFIPFSILLAIAVIILIVLLARSSKRKISPHDEEISRDIERLVTRRKEIESAIAKKDAELRQLDNRYKEMVERQHKSMEDMLRAQNKEVSDAAALTKETIEKLNAETQEKTKELEELRLKWNELSAQIKEAEEKQVMVQNLAALKKIELDNLIKELEEKQNTMRAVVLAEKGFKDGWYELDLSPQEKKLVGLVNEIAQMYPDLRVDMIGIEWKRVWLPKIQKVCSAGGLDKKGGIYRLVLKSDEKVCYVGQALNFKDRWYQHIKKMIGIEAKGTEKLYEGFRPDDFWWTIQEECSGKELNERERYWINYFCCKEIGLNKK